MATRSLVPVSDSCWKPSKFVPARIERTLTESMKVVAMDYTLIEFDNYAQSPNDAGALKFCTSTLIQYVLAKKPKANDL